MKIWCCLCFGEEKEEEEYKKRETMRDREGILGDLVDCDQVKLEEIENLEELGFQLQEGEGASKSSAENVDFILSLGGECSSSSAVPVVERDGSDRDNYSKRPKVQSYLM